MYWKGGSCLCLFWYFTIFILFVTILSVSHAQLYVTVSKPMLVKLYPYKASVLWVRFWNWKTIKFCELNLWISARIIVFLLDTQYSGSSIIQTPWSCKKWLSGTLFYWILLLLQEAIVETQEKSLIIVRIEGIAFCFFRQLNQVSPQQTDVIEHHYRVYERLQKIRAETEEVGTLFECCYCFVSLFRCLWGSTHL